MMLDQDELPDIDNPNLLPSRRAPTPEMYAIGDSGEPGDFIGPELKRRLETEPAVRALVAQHRSIFPPDPLDSPGGMSKNIFPSVPVLLEPTPGTLPSPIMDGPGGLSEMSLPLATAAPHRLMPGSSGDIDFTGIYSTAERLTGTSDHLPPMMPDTGSGKRARSESRMQYPTSRS